MADDLVVSPFVYPDTASTRAGIEAVSRRLAGGTIAIIGLGGTGSVVLDLISKTPADRIMLIDGDRAEQHNAFRWPGAMAIEDIAEGLGKVEYFARVYGQMHTGITAHAAHLNAETILSYRTCLRLTAATRLSQLLCD